MKKTIWILGGFSFLICVAGVAYAAELIGRQPPENAVLSTAILTAILTSAGIVLGKWGMGKIIKRDCSDCSEIQDLRGDIIIIKEILLALAAKAGLKIDDYKGLVK